MHDDPEAILSRTTLQVLQRLGCLDVACTFALVSGFVIDSAYA